MNDLKWWQTGIVYQVYPRSFQDTNGDGIGDLRGILQRLDHLVQLGVDALWISPIYPSPMADFGYDVSDYCGIDPIFGTLQDFDELLARAHALGLKLILDFVPNHTSDQHPWFVESRASRDNPKRDWYLWRDPSPDGGPPNNWTSQFGGAAWELDAATEQYYLHSFLKQQPDLNWRNPAVRDAMYAALRFWLDRGVDGFRVDVMWLLIKDDRFRNNPTNPGYIAGQPENWSLLPAYNSNRPETHEVVGEMRAVLDAYSDRVLIGEIYLPVHELVSYYGQDLKGANLPFNFQLLETAWKPEALQKIIADYQAALPPGAWPNWVLGNHDKPRIATRIGAAQARVAAMLLLTLWGTPTIYYGEEIGMTDVAIPPEEVQDPAEKNEPGLGMGRDPERTPMPWDGSPLAGFTSGVPWLKIAPDHDEVNVAKLSKEADSTLNLYRKLTALRRQSAALVAGSLSGVAVSGDVLTYERQHGGERLAVFLNMRHDAQEVATPAGRILLSTCMDREDEAVGPSLSLRPAEGVLISLE